MMHRLSLVLLFMVSPFGMGTVLAQSAGTPSDSPPDLSGPEAKIHESTSTPKASPPATPKAKSVSDETASMLAAGLPTYEPPKPEPQAVPEELGSDLRDSDKPKNGIIRLPKYIVRPPKPPVFREQDIYTQKGLEELAVKRYLSEFDRGVLNRFTVPLFGKSNEARALQQYQEDQRLANMADLKDTADAVRRGGDAAESEYLSRISRETYMRSDDWGPIPQK